MVPIVCVVALAAALVVVIVLDRRQIAALLATLEEEREKSRCLSAIAADLANQSPLDDTLIDHDFDISVPPKSYTTHAGEAG